MSESGLIIALFTVLFTLFVVLTERKLLAYAMRRMGPTLMGRNGAFQIALDLFKLVTKETFFNSSTNYCPCSSFFNFTVLLSTYVFSKFRLRSFDVFI